MDYNFNNKPFRDKELKEDLQFLDKIGLVNN